jgi:hypothetical protein
MESDHRRSLRCYQGTKRIAMGGRVQTAPVPHQDIFRTHWISYGGRLEGKDGRLLCIIIPDRLTQGHMGHESSMICVCSSVRPSTNILTYLSKLCTSSTSGEESPNFRLRRFCSGTSQSSSAQLPSCYFVRLHWQQGIFNNQRKTRCYQSLRWLTRSPRKKDEGLYG